MALSNLPCEKGGRKGRQAEEREGERERGKVQVVLQEGKNIVTTLQVPGSSFYHPLAWHSVQLPTPSA